MRIGDLHALGDVSLSRFFQSISTTLMELGLKGSVENLSHSQPFPTLAQFNVLQRLSITARGTVHGSTDGAGNFVVDALQWPDSPIPFGLESLHRPFPEDAATQALCPSLRELSLGSWMLNASRLEAMVLSRTCDFSDTASSGPVCSLQNLHLERITTQKQHWQFEVVE